MAFKNTQRGKEKTDTKKIEVNPAISVITLNANCITFKRTVIFTVDKNTGSIYMLFTRESLNMKTLIG